VSAKIAQAKSPGLCQPPFRGDVSPVKFVRGHDYGWLGWALVLLGLALGVTFGSTPSATAQGSEKAAAQKLELIRERMEQGQGLYVGGKYQEAAALFESGFKDHPYSAFLFNAGVCYQKLNDYKKALEMFNEYLRIDPQAPDAAKVNDRIRALEAALQKPTDAGVVPTDAGALEGGAPEAGPPPVIQSDDDSAMKSLVVIETEPANAPLTLYYRESPNAQPFKLGAENVGWTRYGTRRSPANLTLAVGHYHVVVEKFRDFNESETDIDVQPGRVLVFKANLSQGAFMSFLRVSANVRGAYIFIDDEKTERPPWGNVPHGELVAPGKHKVLLEAPGFEPLLADIDVVAGEQKEVQVKLSRLDWGYLRIDSDAPEIKVSLDEKPAGTWRSGEVPLDVRGNAGRHMLKVTSDGRKTFDGPVEIKGGLVVPIKANMIPKYPRGAAWTQAVLSAAFIGAGVFFGTESDKLHDQLVADRASGRLEEGDSRALQGRWYAIGSNAGFAIGGVLAVISTYNFIKDPLPESSLKPGTPLEFEDPRKAPVAALRVREPKRSERRREVAAKERPLLRPYVDPNGGGLMLGGSF
jgi:hypothetical protein